jgi:hypothetical protein
MTINMPFILPSLSGVIWRIRPLGNPNFLEISVGRDVLVLAGTARITGVFYTSVQLFHNKNSAGGIFCVLVSLRMNWSHADA